MHRNAEIWAKRHERLETIREVRLADFKMAKRSTSGVDAQHVGHAQRLFTERWDALERRVWHALCLARGWRKA